jgi:hypothetical protein
MEVDDAHKMHQSFISGFADGNNSTHVGAIFHFLFRETQNESRGFPHVVVVGQHEPFFLSSRTLKTKTKNQKMISNKQKTSFHFGSSNENGRKQFN